MGTAENAENAKTKNDGVSAPSARPWEFLGVASLAVVRFRRGETAARAQHSGSYAIVTLTPAAARVALTHGTRGPVWGA